MRLRDASSSNGKFNMNSGSHEVRYLPSTREIKRVCLQIQAEWSPAERIRRIVRRRQHWLPPFVRAADWGLLRADRQRDLKN
jgi:hypothetical protein